MPPSRACCACPLARYFKSSVSLWTAHVCALSYICTVLYMHCPICALFYICTVLYMHCSIYALFYVCTVLYMHCPIYALFYICTVLYMHYFIYALFYICTVLYRVSQEECARLRKGVPYVKVYRYNPKHLCPKLNGYGDNGQRKVWSSGGSTHCTCQLTSLIDVCPCVWCRIQLTLAVQLCSRLIPECEVSHVKSVLAMHVSCIVLGTLRTTMTCERVFL